MNALSFSRDGDTITITHNGKERSWTIAELKTLVSQYLVYYRDGYAEEVDVSPCSFDAYREPPPFEKEYWSHRYELYAYAQDLFPLTLTVVRAEDVDEKAFIAELKKMVTKEEMTACLNAWKDFDAALVQADLRAALAKTALADASHNACLLNTLTDAVTRLAFSYGIKDSNEAQKLNPVYSQMYPETCAQYKIAEFLKDPTAAKRDAVLDTVDARNTFCESFINNW